MAILTYKNIPKERWEEIRAYVKENNLVVTLENKIKARLFLEIKPREFDNSPLIDIELVVRAPVDERDGERANEAIKSLARFIIGQDQSLELL